MVKVAEIIETKEGEGKKGSWTLIRFRTDDGRTASSFDAVTVGDEVSMVAKAFKDREGVERQGWNATKLAQAELGLNDVILNKLEAMHTDIKALRDDLADKSSTINQKLADADWNKADGDPPPVDEDLDEDPIDLADIPF